MARNNLRPIIKLRSMARTGYTYVTRKNRRNDRIVLRKYDPVVRRHVEVREENDRGAGAHVRQERTRATARCAHVDKRRAGRDRDGDSR